MTTTTRVLESTASAPTTPLHLLLAFELGERSWKLGFTTGMGQRPRIRQVPAGAVGRVLEEIATRETPPQAPRRHAGAQLKSSAGARFGTRDNSAGWSAGCRRRFKAARRPTTRASRAPETNMYAG